MKFNDVSKHISSLILNSSNKHPIISKYSPEKINPNHVQKTLIKTGDTPSKIYNEASPHYNNQRSTKNISSTHNLNGVTTSAGNVEVIKHKDYNNNVFNYQSNLGNTNNASARNPNQDRKYHEFVSPYNYTDSKAHNLELKKQLSDNTGQSYVKYGGNDQSFFLHNKSNLERNVSNSIFRSTQNQQVTSQHNNVVANTFLENSDMGTPVLNKSYNTQAHAGLRHELSNTKQYVPSNDNSVNYKVNEGNYKVYENKYINMVSKPNVTNSINRPTSTINHAEYSRSHTGNVSNYRENDYKYAPSGKLVSSYGGHVGNMADNRMVKYGSAFSTHDVNYGDTSNRGTRYIAQNSIDYRPRGINQNSVNRNFYV